MSHVTTIVFDLDDTISFTVDRDWENAYCDPEMKAKINRLYDEGWTIVIHTARGQISCDGNINAIYDKYHDLIIGWLNRNGVKFHELKFGKPLASFYVDDKALRPDEFKSLEIQKLSGGLSGAIVIRTGDRIYKTDKNAIDVAKWYKMSELYDVYKTPKFYSVVGDTISIQYIDGTPFKNIKSGTLINSVIGNILEAGKTPAYGDFKTYAKRVTDHLDLCTDLKTRLKVDLHSMLNNVQLTHAFNKHISFCHGDLTLDNIIIRDGSVYYIDPIPMFDGQYSSYLLDVSKFIQSCERNNLYDQQLLRKLFFLDDETSFLIELLVLTHWVRMLKYAKAGDIDLYHRSLNVIETKFERIKEMYESRDNQRL